MNMQFITRKRWLFGALLLFLALFLNFGTISSQALNNAGVILQNQSLTQSNHRDNRRYLDWSIFLLESAVDRNRNNMDALRNLGYGYAYASRVEDALVVWKAHGNMEQELLKRANIAEEVKDHDGALLWYEMTVRIAPELSEAWYDLALFHKSNREWEAAIFALEEAIVRAQQEDCKSDSLFHLGKIYQSAPEFVDLSKATKLFDTALEHNQFCEGSIIAETYYSLGEIYVWQGRPRQDILPLFEQAVNLNPNHQWAVLRLSVTRFNEDGDWETAVNQISHVIAVWERDSSPNLKWGYRFLGDVYFKAGLFSEALSAYQQALTLDATDNYVQAQIDELIERE